MPLTGQDAPYQSFADCKACQRARGEDLFVCCEACISKFLIAFQADTRPMGAVISALEQSDEEAFRA